MQQGGKVPEAIITDTGVGALGLGGHNIDVLGVTGWGDDRRAGVVAGQRHVPGASRGIACGGAVF